jgi:exodeoxyribonuclease-3
VKLCTFNVNSIRARMGLVAEWLRQRGADIDVLCLQELKTVDGGFPSGEFRALGYTCRTFGQKAYNGVAVCSKTEPESVKIGFGDPQMDVQSRIITARFGGLHVVNVYAPHGGFRGDEKFAYKLRWYDALLEYLKCNFRPEDDLILTGDLNVAMTDIDVHDPVLLKDAIGTMQEERAALARILDYGFIDAFRRMYPDGRQFTWWDYAGGAVWKDEGMRIDYVLCTRNLASRLKSVEVDMRPRKRRSVKTSDHTAVIAEFE